MIKGLLSDTDRIEIVKYRIEKAYRTYQEAVGSIKHGYVETAANRLYYAAYYAVSALLISYKYEASTHNGVIHPYYRYHYYLHPKDKVICQIKKKRE